MALTKRQKQVLDFLADFVERNGFSPSYEELAEGLGLASLATVHKHVLALETKHYVRRSFNQSRSLEITPKYLQERRRYQQEPALAEVPLVGQIAAGKPVESAAGEETLNFAEFARGAGTFALEVRGDSMVEDHICSGDFVLAEKAERVRDGDIVVALVDGMETTLKRYYDEPDGRIRLQPANSSMQPIYVLREQLEIQGRVIAVMRKYR